MQKLCMLEENKICDNCLECNTCDKDSKKICDNCAKCLDDGSAFRTVELDDVIIAEDLRRKFKLIATQLSKR